MWKCRSEIKQKNYERTLMMRPLYFFYTFKKIFIYEDLTRCDTIELTKVIMKKEKEICYIVLSESFLIINKYFMK